MGYYFKGSIPFKNHSSLVSKWQQKHCQAASKQPSLNRPISDDLIRGRKPAGALSASTLLSSYKPL